MQTVDEEGKIERSFCRPQSPVAKLSNPFAHCQEYCHINVTSAARQERVGNGIKLLIAGALNKKAPKQSFLRGFFFSVNDVADSAK